MMLETSQHTNRQFFELHGNDAFEEKPKSNSPLSDEVAVLYRKGEFIAAGITSLVERLPYGNIIKTARTDYGKTSLCRSKLSIEKQIYERLGKHPRILEVMTWDPSQYTLILEYMPNGKLERYVRSNISWTTRSQQIDWMAEVAEGLQYLHSAGVIYCDLGPHNLLLDSRLRLKIVDFAGSSLDSSPASVSPAPAYTAPDPDWHPGKVPTKQDDLFSLGSIMYFIATGKHPFEGLERDEVHNLFLDGKFPDMSVLDSDEIIRLCWHQEACSARQVYDLVQQLRRKSSSCPKVLSKEEGHIGPQERIYSFVRERSEV